MVRIEKAVDPGSLLSELVPSTRLLFLVSRLTFSVLTPTFPLAKHSVPNTHIAAPIFDADTITTFSINPQTRTPSAQTPSVILTSVISLVGRFGPPSAALSARAARLHAFPIPQWTPVSNDVSAGVTVTRTRDLAHDAAGTVVAHAARVASSPCERCTAIEAGALTGDGPADIEVPAEDRQRERFP